MANHQTAQPKKKRGDHTLLKWFGLVLGTLALIGVTTSAILACYAAAYIQDKIMPQVNSSNAAMLDSGTELSSVVYYYDRKDSTWQELQTLHAEENRVWVPYDEIPEDLIHATVAIEDKRFFNHHGVDWKRTAAGMVYMFTGKRVQGGSTITQQLIKNLTHQNQVTVRRKILEIFEALQFDRTHTKEEIIEWYLNEIYLGRQCFGVKTAAKLYFNKNVKDLGLAECAALISITNNPSLYDPYTHPANNLKRCRLVLDQMREQGYIDQKTCDEAKKEAENLNFTVGSRENEESGSGDYYSWYTDEIIEQVIKDLEAEYGYDEKTATHMLYAGGLKIYSCYDPEVQKDVDKVYTNANSVEGWDSLNGDILQSAITVVDNRTGAVVALSGGIGEKVGYRIWNRATDTVRQPGSALKPIAVFAQALEKGDILPNTIVEDSPFSKVNGRSWPKNSHGGYNGNVDVTYAMAQSLNTVAVKVLDMVGAEESYEFLTEKLHISTLVKDYVSKTGKKYSDVGYAQLALGGVTKGISTYEMAGAYSTFPRDGVFVKPHLYSAVVNSQGELVLATPGYQIEVDANGNATVSGGGTGEAVFSTSTCYYMNQMMEKVVTEGTGTNAAIEGMNVAGKTGTTDDDFDRWFVGYTPYYTAAVWTGYDKASPIQSVNNPACVLWQQVMEQVSKGQEAVPFTECMDGEPVTFCGKCGGLATGSSSSTQTISFLPGDEPDYSCSHSWRSSKKKK